MNQLQEYGFQNGNGNGPAKIFSLKPATDPITMTILNVRRECLADARVPRAVRGFFCEVLDRSLNPSCPGFVCKGTVSISDTTLARIFNVSARTVYTWKMSLAILGYIWLSQKFRTDRIPITTYNVTVLRPKTASFRQEDDGSGQHGKLRSGFANPGLGCRKPGQPGLALPGSRTAAAATENEESRAISAESGNLLRVTAEAGFRNKEAQNRVSKGTESKTVIRLGNPAGSNGVQKQGEVKRVAFGWPFWFGGPVW